MTQKTILIALIFAFQSNKLSAIYEEIRCGSLPPWPSAKITPGTLIEKKTPIKETSSQKNHQTKQPAAVAAPAVPYGSPPAYESPSLWSRIKQKTKKIAKNFRKEPIYLENGKTKKSSCQNFSPQTSEKTQKITMSHIKTLERLYQEDNSMVEAIARGDITGVRDISRKERNQVNLRFHEAHPIFAAIHNEYECAICMEPVEPSHYDVGSNYCFHFMCSICKQQWSKECPTCKQ